MLERTLIATVRDHVEAWRRDMGHSRETAAQLIVEAHEGQGFDKLTGIRFAPPTADAYERMRVNADRIFRWLDDATKDKNHLPANFLLSILAALPMARRIALLDALLAPVGVGASEILDDSAVEADEGLTVLHFQAVAVTGTDAQVALADLIKDGIQPGEPEAAQGRLKRAAEAFRRALAFVGKLRLRRSGGKS